MHDLLVEMGKRLSVETLVSSGDPIDQVRFNFPSKSQAAMLKCRHT